MVSLLIVASLSLPLILIAFAALPHLKMPPLSGASRSEYRSRRLSVKRASLYSTFGEITRRLENADSEADAALYRLWLLETENQIAEVNAELEAIAMDSLRKKVESGRS